MAGGEANHRAVGQIDGALHESLAEGAATDHQTAVVVLHGAGNDLGGRGTELIDEDNQTSLAEKSAGEGIKHLFRRGAAFGVDHQIFGVEELAGHFDRGAEITAAVALQVEEQVFHALLFELLDGVAHLFTRGGAEAIEADVADTRGYHVSRIEGVHRNLVAGHDKGERFAHRRADDAELHLRAFGATKQFHDAISVKFHPGDGASVDRDDAIAVDDAGFLRRAFGDGLNHHEGVFEHIELHADTFEVAFERFVHAARFFGVGVGRVGIQFRKHAVDGIFDEFFLIDTVDIKLGDGQLRDGQFAH